MHIKNIDETSFLALVVEFFYTYSTFVSKRLFKSQIKCKYHNISYSITRSKVTVLDVQDVTVVSLVCDRF